MSVDPIANMLSRLKNAAAVGKEFVEVSHSRELEDIAQVLEENGYLSEVKRFKQSGSVYKGLRLVISYQDGGKSPSFIKLARVSRPGQRIYQGRDGLRGEKGRLLVVSTPKGVMSHREAVKKNVGGEVLLEVK